MKFSHLYWTPRPNQAIWNFVEYGDLDELAQGLLLLVANYGPQALCEHDWH